MNADGRIITNMTRVECQSYGLNYDDEAPINYIAKYVGQLKQKFTQKGGARPFGVSTLLVGFDTSNKPRVFQTEPSGNTSEWKASSVGRSSKQVTEFLEKNFKDEMKLDEALKLTCKALLDVV